MTLTRHVATCCSVLLLCGALTAAARADAARYSATSLYNLGNSYARAGKPGLAVLNYERAILLAPDDPDIAANLRFVRDTAKVPAAPQNWFERTFSTLPPTPLYWTGLAGIVLLGCCALAARASSRHRTVLRLGAVVGAALAAVTVCNGIVLWARLHEAVVLAATTPVRVSPVPMGDPLFTLPEAETVRMTAAHEGFVLVQTRTGKTGWVANANIAPVVPRR